MIIAKDEEVKAIDTSILQAVDAGGAVTKLNQPTQGDGVSQRDGDVIKVKRLRVRFTMIGADSTNVLRIIIFRWHNNDATLVPTIVDVLQAANPISQYQYTSQTQGEFHIVVDKTFMFSLNGTLAKSWIVNYYGRKLGRKNVNFNAALATGTDMFYMIAISDSIGAGHPSVAGTTRMEYTDS